ncbi:MAG TPA: tripartite tricarboxylate transporter substrate-binding protein [Beijerinckiaceae bacterium]
MSHLPLLRAASAAILLTAAGGARAAPVEDFYKGKTLTILVGFSTGNGADSYARLLSRFMSKHVPGAPTIVVQNMPGAGSLTMANYLFAVAPKDGSVIGVFNRNLPLEPLMGNKSVRFDPRKFSWIGSTNTEPSLCVAWHTSPVQSIADMQAKPFTIAATSLSANSGLVPTVLNKVMGTKTKIVMGYPGSNEMSLALERQEVEGRCGWSRSSLMATKAAWVADKKVTLLLQAGLRKSAAMPEVPLAMDHVKGEREKALLKLAVAWDEMAWPFAAPPGAPAERVEALRAAFASALADPDLLAQAKKEGLDVSLVTGPDVEALLADVYATPPDIIEEMQAIVKEPTR